MSDVFLCGVCGERGPWMLTLWWRDNQGMSHVPGGQSLLLKEEPRMTIACSMECGRQFAREVSSNRISITRPESDMRRARDLIEALNADADLRAACRDLNRRLDGPMATEASGPHSIHSE